jgi:hypothetical protein
MGWWSYDIMGGDTPLDYESFIYEILKVEKFPEGTDEINLLTKEQLEEHQKKLLKLLKNKMRIL